MPRSQRWVARLLPGGIRERLFLLIALAAVPVLVLQVYLYYQRHNARRNEAMRDESEVAQGVAMTFSAYLDGVRHQLEAVGQTILAFSPYTDAKVLRVFKAAVAGQPSMRSINWVNPEGTILASNLPDGAGQDLSFRPYFRQIQTGAAWTLGDLTEQGAILPAPTVAMGVAVRDDDGRLLGVVVASFEPTRLGELTFPHKRHTEGTYSIFDRDGILVYHNPSVPLTWEDRLRWQRTDPLLQQALSGEAAEGIIASSTTTGNQVAARVPIGETGWVAGAASPIEVAMGPVRRALFQDALLGSIVASLALLLAALSARTIAGPLRRLEHDAQAIGAGGAGSMVPDIEAPIEVRKLRGSVTTMASDLISRAEALEKSEKRYRTLFTNMSEGFALGEATFDNYGVACDFRFLEINDAFEQQTGLTRAIVGRPMKEVLPHVEPNWIDAFCDVARTGESARFVEYSRHTAKHYDVFCYSPAEGRFAVLFRDVTERTLAEQALRDVKDRLQEQTEELQTQAEELQAQTEELRISEERYRRLFEDDLTGNFIAAIDGHILLCNAAFAKIYGFAGPEEAIGSNLMDLKVHPENWMKLLDEARQHRIVERFESDHRRRNGDMIRIVENIVGVFDAEGQLIQVQGYIVDITERKRAEEALRKLTATLESQVARRTAELEHRARQLQKLTLELSQTEDRERRRLADILHDDLQQQLAAIKFHLGLLAGHLRHDMSLQKTAIQLDRMLTNAVETSRSLSHELSPAMLYQATLGESLEWLAAQIRTKHGLDVRVHADGEIALESDALKAFLYKAAQEMLFNVVKHARVGQARVRVRRVDRCVCLAVSDHGRGFDPQDLKATAGFGLFSIRERVQLLGGRMRIKGVPNKGSTFFIAVPDSPEQRTEDNRRSSSVLSPRSPVLRVLVADDHEIVRQGLAALLREQEDIQFVGEAANGREAVDLASRLRPDVVIMDVAMPLMNGDEATRQTKMHLPGTRVVALSMYAEDGMVERMRRAGADCYILKTAPADELLAAIRGKRACA